MNFRDLHLNENEDTEKKPTIRIEFNIDEEHLEKNIFSFRNLYRKQENKREKKKNNHGDSYLDRIEQNILANSKKGDFYDIYDPFIDDSEFFDLDDSMSNNISETATNGFFVWKGQFDPLDKILENIPKLNLDDTEDTVTSDDGEEEEEEEEEEDSDDEDEEEEEEEEDENDEEKDKIKKDNKLKSKNSNDNSEDENKKKKKENEVEKDSKKKKEKDYSSSSKKDKSEKSDKDKDDKKEFTGSQNSIKDEKTSKDNSSKKNIDEQNSESSNKKRKPKSSSDSENKIVKKVKKDNGSGKNDKENSESNSSINNKYNHNNNKNNAATTINNNINKDELVPIPFTDPFEKERGKKFTALLYPLPQSLSDLIDNYRKTALTLSWDQKRTFPTVMKTLLGDIVKLAVDLELCDDNFRNHIQSCIPYNAKTIKNLINRRLNEYLPSLLEDVEMARKKNIQLFKRRVSIAIKQLTNNYEDQGIII